MWNVSSCARSLTEFNVFIAWFFRQEGSFIVIVAHAWFPQNANGNWTGIDLTRGQSMDSWSKRVHAMVLVTINPKHDESTIKQKIGWGKRKRRTSIRSFSVSQQSETYWHSQMRIGWNEELCKRLDRVAREDHSYIAPWDERRRNEKNWKLGSNTQGPVGPVSEYSEAVQKVREIRQSRGRSSNSSEPTSAVIPKIRDVDARPKNGMDFMVIARISLFFDSKVETICVVVFSKVWRALSENQCSFSRFSLTGNRDSLASDGGVHTTPHWAHFTYAKHFLACGSRYQHASFLVSFRKTVISTVTDHVSLAAILAWLHSFSTSSQRTFLTSSCAREYPLQSAPWSPELWKDAVREAAGAILTVLFAWILETTKFSLKPEGDRNARDGVQNLRDVGDSIEFMGRAIWRTNFWISNRHIKSFGPQPSARVDVYGCCSHLLGRGFYEGSHGSDVLGRVPPRASSHVLCDVGPTEARPSWTTRSDFFVEFVAARAHWSRPVSPSTKIWQTWTWKLAVLSAHTVSKWRKNVGNSRTTSCSVGRTLSTCDVSTCECCWTAPDAQQWQSWTEACVSPTYLVSEHVRVLEFRAISQSSTWQRTHGEVRQLCAVEVRWQHSVVHKKVSTWFQPMLSTVQRCRHWQKRNKFRKPTDAILERTRQQRKRAQRVPDVESRNTTANQGSLQTVWQT